MDNKKSIGFSHGELVELLKKLREGFMLNETQVEFEDALLTKAKEALEAKALELEGKIEAAQEVLQAEIDADVKVEADRALLAEEAIVAEIDVKIAAAMAIEKEAILVLAEGKADAMDSAVIAKITEAKAALQNEIDADVLVEAERAQAAEVALQAEIDADVKVEEERAVAREDELQAALDEANAKIAALETECANLLTKINLKAANADLQQAEADIATLEAWKAEIVLAVSQMQSDIQSFQGLETRIEALENR